ncbi:hypothetical protein DPMN_008833 [Dreissena polymorpha]|uniref:PABS domain-containing protein n=1 Tax=Dreissena polymorpha TaxID=45954 RepID=A0A9D4RZL6_DREPO|nr:hypothetical protein DPMN_008833 [Dreissena polymorpha]
MAGSLSDPRCHVNIGDGIQYMKEHKDSFDIIITDAPDPIGLCLLCWCCWLLGDGCVL